MPDALLVNPYDTEATADAIHNALNMPLDERRARHERLLEGIRRQDVHWWRQAFLDRLNETAP
jgi:trehalose 6-phosphate synthase